MPVKWTEWVPFFLTGCLCIVNFKKGYGVQKTVGIHQDKYSNPEHVLMSYHVSYLSFIVVWKIVILRLYFLLGLLEF